MRLVKEQVEVLSDYFSDISKIVAGSAVVGFFIPGDHVQVSVRVFGMGVAVSLILLVTAVGIRRS